MVSGQGRTTGLRNVELSSAISILEAPLLGAASPLFVTILDAVDVAVVRSSGMALAASSPTPKSIGNLEATVVDGSD
jgi:hypothetical protein